ncbi:MAG: hypothetical protein A2729_04250 [Candidatus Buchananbacteria bacterium RIFCSPHIGHO2_01_FULL_39_14]|uniref:Uncharacterized protein n=1 Tax=Candidatus Buchananbacteria bacterium RIFCSPHIGHO2_01_FULL_39_14 TaxID=1797532 RepID=A0A1G1XVG9_9BACT|nr:MAG: hypothetical protein A2729_04250 [Candidatus Buchananbacteria bacterium RIFCSPHIGHO2_01_FULL_39_14]
MAQTLFDTLITVHYDNMDQNHFVREQIESRITEYLHQGYTVYNLSTFQHPPAREKVRQISSPSEDAWLDYDLGSQIEQLVPLLKEAHKMKIFPEIEIVGVTWWKCVEQARYLLSQHNVPVQINYDYTDLVCDYVGIKALGITFSMDGKPIPIPSDMVLEKYRKSMGGE